MRKKVKLCKDCGRPTARPEMPCPFFKGQLQEREWGVCKKCGGSGLHNGDEPQGECKDCHGTGEYIPALKKLDEIK